MTLTAAVVLFVVVFIATPRGLGVRLSSAVIAAMAAPMIFELPFDLIVMARTYPPVPPDPVLYRTLFFAPLVLVELTTLSLLAVSPMMKLSRPAFFCLALILLVFAFWALAGFGYPSAPIPIAMNVVSKILAFVTAPSCVTEIRLPTAARLEPAPGGRRWTGKLGTEARHGPGRARSAEPCRGSRGKGSFPARCGAAGGTSPARGRAGH
ncbi:MAG: hypothetical protein WAK44_24570 [Trebonia sp.]